MIQESQNVATVGVVFLLCHGYCKILIFLFGFATIRFGVWTDFCFYLLLDLGFGVIYVWTDLCFDLCIICVCISTDLCLEFGVIYATGICSGLIL